MVQNDFIQFDTQASRVLEQMIGMNSMRISFWNGVTSYAPTNLMHISNLKNIYFFLVNFGWKKWWFENSNFKLCLEISINIHIHSFFNYFGFMNYFRWSNPCLGYLFYRVYIWSPFKYWIVIWLVFCKDLFKFFWKCVFL